jgi:GT2 family glycosyltransferase
VPTLGRSAQLEACLASIAACDPPGAELLVVDQSGSEEIRRIVDRFSEAGARCLHSSPRGKARASNLALREARNEIVLFTDDDCTVEPSWVSACVDAVERDPSALATGRVLAPDGAGHVPSTIEDRTPRVYAGTPRVDALYWGNMAGRRSALVAVGGFDTRLTLAAADNDLCWRWLRSGRRIRYEPNMVVFHHDWRDASELDAVYARYARGQGALYGKHLRRGDLYIARFLVRDIAYVVRALAAALLRGGLRTDPWARGIARQLPRGLADGWRAARESD